MKFSIIAALAALAAGVQAGVYSNSSAVTTEVLTAYTTYCPEATQFAVGEKTYTATAATTLTLTDGPYTVTKALSSKVVTACSACTQATVAPSKPASNGTATFATPTKTPTASISAFTGAAGNVAAGSGALAAIMGFAIMVL